MNQNEILFWNFIISLKKQYSLNELKKIAFMFNYEDKWQTINNNHGKQNNNIIFRIFFKKPNQHTKTYGAEN